MPYKECQETASIPWAARPKTHHRHSPPSPGKFFTYEISGDFEKGDGQRIPHPSQHIHHGTWSASLKQGPNCHLICKQAVD